MVNLLESFVKFFSKKAENILLFSTKLMLINLTLQCGLMFIHMSLAEYNFVGPGQSSWFVYQWPTNVAPLPQLKM